MDGRKTQSFAPLFSCDELFVRCGWLGCLGYSQPGFRQRERAKRRRGEQNLEQRLLGEEGRRFAVSLSQAHGRSRSRSRIAPGPFSGAWLVGFVEAYL